MDDPIILPKAQKPQNSKSFVILNPSVSLRVNSVKNLVLRSLGFLTSSRAQDDKKSENRKSRQRTDSDKKRNPLLVNLEKVELDEANRPFVSVHVALYNERRVVERLIRACCAQNWAKKPIKPIQTDDTDSVKSAKNQLNQFVGEANYEVVIADDSTDETTQIVKEYLVSGIGYQVSRTEYNPSSPAATEGQGDELEVFRFDPPAAVTERQRAKGDRESDGFVSSGSFVTSVSPLPVVKLIHRFSRAGYKGAALQGALERTDPRAKYIVVVDADFVPYQDTIEQFVKTFQVLSVGSEEKVVGSREASSTNYQLQTTNFSNIAAIQGYQWHVLNKSQNWITKGVRTEYAGSYVIERTADQVFGGLKQIAGSVYCIRADVLRGFGWGTSITEDFELTLRLYEQGWKVVFTPYIQIPAEAVSTIKRLIRQRMRWAEGSSHNIKLMFLRIWASPNMTFVEKLRFFYFSFYYIQAAFFIAGTFAWFFSETVLQVKLPFWTSALGWSLVITNLMALPLMNIVGLFLEESEERDYVGIISFILISYVVVPFQAYAAVKGFLEKEEGPWFRTPKTGAITDTVKRTGFGKFFGRIIAGGKESYGPKVSHSQVESAENSSSVIPDLIRNLRLDSRFRGNDRKEDDEKQRPRFVGKIALAGVILCAVFINLLAFVWTGQPKMGVAKVKVGVGAISASIPVPQISSGIGGSELASVLDPALEQQVNIIDQEFTTTSTSDTPTDGSLGIVTYAGTGDGNYSDPTVYFEAVIKNDKTDTTTVNLYDLTTGSNVSGSTISTTSGSYTRVRSGAITPTAGDDFTIVIKGSGGAGGTAYILAARLIILQVNPTLLTDTQTQAEVGNGETTTSTTMTTLTNPKYFSYDDSKYDGTRNAYFEATLKGDTAFNTGTFATTSQGQLAQPVRLQSAMTSTIGSSSYVYVLGGNSPSSMSFSTVYKATFNATTGDIGGFATTSQAQLSQPLRSFASTSLTLGSSTYAYVLGGCAELNGGLICADTVSSTVYKSTVNGSTGDLGAFDTTSQAQLPVKLQSIIQGAVTSTVGSSTYMYVLGGCSVGNCTTFNSTVYKSTVNTSSGDVGAFSTASQGQLPARRIQHTSLAVSIGSSTYVYVLGGCPATCAPVSTVYKSTVDGSGNLGTFSTNSQAQLPGILMFTPVATSNVGSSTYLYVIGGCKSGNCTAISSTVYKSTIDNTTGNLGTFATTSQTQFPQTIYRSNVVSGNFGSSTYAYVLGGCSAATCGTVSTVFKSALSQNTVSAELYNRTDGTTVTESAISESSGSWTRVRSSALSTNWDTASADEYEMRFKTSGGTASVANAKVVLTQNASAGLTKMETYHQYDNTAQTYSFSAGDAGTFATTNQGQLPLNRYFHGTETATFGSSTYLYVIGGFSTAQTSTLYKSTLNGSSGDVGTFSTVSQAQLPVARYGIGTATTTFGSSTYMYVIGGQAGSGPESTVFKATLDGTNGNTGTFSTTSQSQLPNLRYGPSVATSTFGSSTYLYVIGGRDGSASSSSVYKSTLVGDPSSGGSGNAGTFSTTSQGQLLVVRRFQGTFTKTFGSSTYIYVLGGDASTNETNAISSVYKAVLDGSNGNIGSFSSASQTQLPNNLYGFGTVTSSYGSSTYLYILGGRQNSTTTFSTVYKSLLNFSTGDIGAFSTTSQSQLPLGRYGPGAVSSTFGSSTYLYVTGGSANSTVYKSTLNGGGGTFGYNNLYNSNNWIGGTFTYAHETTFKQSTSGVTGSVALTPGGLGSLTTSSASYGRNRSGSISPTSAQGGNAGTFDTTNQGQLLANREAQTSVVSTLGSSSYVYVLGGCSPTCDTSTVYKATFNSVTGDLGTFSTASQGQLPLTRNRFTTEIATVGSSTYIYAIGGCQAGACPTLVSTVYKATLNSSTGDVGTFSTASQTQLPDKRRSHESMTLTFGSSTYLYTLGGCANVDPCSYDSTLYKATLDVNGDVGAFSTSSQAQLFGLWGEGGVTTATLGSSTYVYVVGGINTSIGSTAVSSVYKAQVNTSTGDIAGTFSTTSQAQLPTRLYANNDQTFSATIGPSTYMYVVGGDDWVSATSTVYRATFDGSGNIGAFSTTSQAQLPAARKLFNTNVMTLNGSTYIYAIAGSGSSTAYKSLISADGTEYDAQLQAATVSNDWMVVTVTSLATPEWLLAFIPFGVFLPRVVKRLKGRFKI